jgi:hypothetical protein
LTPHKASGQTEVEVRQIMNAYASSADNFSRQFEEFMAGVTDEVHHAVAYIDAVIVPEIRRESGSALRTMATHLERWADKLDPNGKRGL